MEKDFDGWNEKKKAIDRYNSLVLYHEREIWWCNVGINVGHESNGKNLGFSRPVLVLKKFGRFLFWGLPLTHTIKEGEFYYNFEINERSPVSSVMLSQLRAFDVARLTRKMGMIDLETFSGIRSQVKRFL